MSDLFISYASVDRERADRLHARLTAEGFSVWLDARRLQPGAHWDEEINVACEAARVMLPLVTSRWKDSEWTRYETYVHGSVIPVLAEGDPRETLPPPLRGLHAIALDPLAAGEAQWQALIAAIRTMLTRPTPERAPRLVDLPHPANPFFTGRDDDLVRVHEVLHAEPTAALTQGRVSAIVAMGGMGKTTLANEYARRYWRLYPQILWIDTQRGYESEFARLFDGLLPGRAAMDLKPDEKAREALIELNRGAKRLLVIDNALDAESVRPWLPRAATSGCRTLITSRFADWPRAEGVRAISLYVLDPDSARDFLVGRTGRTADGSEGTACEALAKELGGLPLALEQAGAYIDVNPGTGFADYLRFYGDASVKLLAEGHRGSTDYPEPVIATWRATIDKLAPEARAVLWLCAWYADTPIPRTLILEGTEEVVQLAGHLGPMLPIGGSKTADERRMLDALACLRRYSMIRFDAEGNGFLVHGLVQAIERMDLAKHALDEATRDAALRHLAAAFPEAFNDVSTWPFCRQLLPHQQTLVGRLGPDGDDKEVSILLARAASFHLGSGDAASALPLFRRALEGSEQALDPENPLTLICMNNLALCLENLGDAASALPLFQRALELRERVLGPDHPGTLTTMSNLASCLKALGDAASALPLLRRALESSEQGLGPEDPLTLTCVHNVATCLESLGDASSALPLFRRALEGRERVRGREHPETLVTMSNLASCLEAVGDVASALPLFRLALETSERVLGPEHPDTLRSANNLAFGLVKVGEASSALPLFRRALEGRERVFGPEHPETLATMNNLASCLEALGDAVSALPLYRRTLESTERVLGVEHPDTLLKVNNLAYCLDMLGDPASALPLYRRAAEGGKKVLGLQHPLTRQFTNNLAHCEGKLQDRGPDAP